MFAGTHDGLFRSTDRGVTWVPTNNGLRSWNIMTLVTNPESAETLYAGTAAAIYRSSDRGRTWHELKNDLYVTALAIDPRSPSTLYAATHLGVLKSETAGTQWKPLRMAPSLGDPSAPAAAAKRTSAKSDPAASTVLPALPVRSNAAKPRPPSPPPLPVKPSPAIEGGGP
jgi:photosystem II stability/assembly factor-like uncharacterized protein